MGGGGGDTTTTSRVELSPQMQAALYGSETRQLRQGVQPAYATGAWVDMGGDNGMVWQGDAVSNRQINPDSDYEITRTPGLMDMFKSQYEANAANGGLNDMQRNALTAQADFLGGSGALEGYNAQRDVGNYLVNNLLSGQSGGGSAMPTSHSIAGSYGVGGTSYGRDPMPTAAAVPQVQSDGGYGDAMSQILGGTPNNPYLDQMSQAIAGNATTNFQRNVLPSIRSGAALAGGYGGSRQGVAEGLAMSDLNNQILQADTQLRGTAYENAAQRQAALTGQLSAQNLAASQANAANSLAGQQQANDWLLGNRGIDAQMAQASASMANSASNRDLGFAELAFKQRQADISNALTGAGVLGSASQIPLSNMQGLYNVGNTFQGAPMQNLQQYSQNLLPWSGLGATQINTAPGGGGNPIGGAMGGALAGGQLGSTLGGAANGAAYGGYGALIGGVLGLLGSMR